MPEKRPTREQISRLCDAYMAALSAGDLDALEGMFAPGAEQQEPVGTAPNKGWEAIRGFFAGHSGVPVTMTRMGPVLVVGNHALFMAHVRVEAPDGIREMTTGDVLTVDGDCRITELLAFPDRVADPREAPVPPREAAR